jgi:hypothetical protein
MDFFAGLDTHAGFGNIQAAGPDGSLLAADVLPGHGKHGIGEAPLFLPFVWQSSGSLILGYPGEDCQGKLAKVLRVPDSVLAINSE